MAYIGVDRILNVRKDKVFNGLKLYAGIAFSAIAAIFLFLFKKRGEEIDELEEIKIELEQKVNLAEDKEEVSNDVAKFYLDEETKISEKYDEKEEAIHASDNKPLSPSLLSKLRSIQGLSSDPIDPPE